MLFLKVVDSRNEGIIMRIVISDVDKTLNFSDENPAIRVYDRQQIEIFQSLGHLFGICTGRSFSGVKKFIHDYHLKFDFMILSSGAIIVNQNNQIIKRYTLKRNEVENIVEQIKDKIINYSLTCGDIFYYSGEQKYDASKSIVIKDFSEVIGNEFDSFALQFEDVKKLEEVVEQLENNYSNSITTHRNENNLDISPVGCSKGNAIYELKNYLQVDEKDIYVIGDSYNDISMFEAVENSFTFFTSDKLVQSKANYLVNSLGECIQKAMED